MAIINNTDYNADLYAKVGGSSSTSSASGAVQDMETRFLTLLMAQMRNQDPLNPLDNAQVTTQLAQLSTVTGIEKLNQTMTRLLAGYDEAQAMQAASMVGRSVMIAGNNLPMVEGQSIAGIGLAGPADQVQITIKDATGKVVQVENLGAREAGNFYFAWDGTDADGNVLPDGNYTFSVEATIAGQPVDAAPMQIGMVSAVIRGTDGFLLDLGSFGRVAFNDVLQIF
ncbi:flagellar hook assembly protein FlgD [Azonexus sp.]|jgi:flagellar basal-body rod modification protein FlgD|uniref:flagellar hook assembly protein FlgD n=1 Tax=Azonexus sp. TaxID=1872668 RepID=UPI0028258DD5|nr:flagellar hook assembly protein FlgD [Azonexus sp.]MDR1995056.1 flagellar hook assembly protein FlgD [Azonexus sp.]